MCFFKTMREDACPRCRKVPQALISNHRKVMHALHRSLPPIYKGCSVHTCSGGRARGYRLTEGEAGIVEPLFAQG